jgi:hypothetical protein
MPLPGNLLTTAMGTDSAQALDAALFITVGISMKLHDTRLLPPGYRYLQ